MCSSAGVTSLHAPPTGRGWQAVPVQWKVGPGVSAKRCWKPHLLLCSPSLHASNAQWCTQLRTAAVPTPATETKPKLKHSMKAATALAKHGEAMGC